MTRHLTAIIERENNNYVALCPQLDIASQGSDRVRSESKSERSTGTVFRDGFSRRNPGTFAL